MKITCTSCKYSFEIEDPRMPDEGREFTCPKCLHRFFEKPKEGFVREAVKLPVAPASSSYTAKIVLGGFALIAISMCSVIDRVDRPIETKTSNIVESTPPASTPDYEHDIDERCKDWVYQRNRAYKLGREGDAQGAASAGRNMNQFHNDLRKLFTEQQITDAIARVEASGYKAGF